MAILRQGGAYTLLPCDNNLTALGVSEEAFQSASKPAAVKAAIEKGLGEIASLIKPIFYQDHRTTLFVEPDVTERTIEEWEEWIPPKRLPEPGWREPDWWKGWWKDTVLIPERPRKGPLHDPGDPWTGFEIDPGSLIDPKEYHDWLVNPMTVLEFDDVLIGPSGQPGLEIRPGGDFAEDVAGSEVSIDVNPGSGLPLASALVLGDANAFARSGLVQTGGGLNVVRNAGLNSALAQNFNDTNREGFGAERLDAARTER